MLPSCTEGQVFPTEVTTISSDIIQFVPIVCVNGVLGTICRSGFDDQDAIVVCRTIAQLINIEGSGE